MIKPNKLKITASLFCAGAAFFIFRNCFGVFIPADNAGQLYFFSQENIFSMGSGNENASSNFVSFAILYLLFKLFATNPEWWIGASVFLHVIAAILVQVFSEKLLNVFSFRQSFALSFFASLIFLVSPYQVESVLWTPTNLPVLLSTVFFLAALIFSINFFTSGKPGHTLISHGFFVLSVFSYESSFVLPAVVSILFFFLRKTVLAGFRQVGLYGMLPQFGIIIFYFFLTKLIFGSWVWHGGNLELAVPFSVLGGNFLKYLLKFFFFFRYLQLDGLESFLLEIYQNKIVLLLIFIFTIGVLASASYFMIRSKNIFTNALVASFACFCVSLLPVLPLDTSFLSYPYPDRYGYLPSVFFYLFVVIAIYGVFKRWAVPVSLAYAVLCGVLLFKTVALWKSTNDYCRNAIENFATFAEFDRIYVLDAPAYLHGIPAFRSGFRPAMHLRYGWSLEKIRFIAGSYHDSEADTLRSVLIRDSLVRVEGNVRPKPYFSTDGGWARSYETEEYSVIFDSSGNSYSIYFNGKYPRNSAFVYASHGLWKKVN